MRSHLSDASQPPARSGHPGEGRGPVPTSPSLPVVVLLAAALLGGGCAHGPSEEELAKERARTQEHEVLKERVRRLERRLADLDTKMTLLMQKAEAEASPAMPRAVSSTGAYPPQAYPSSPYAGPGGAGPVTPAPTPAPEPGYDFETRVPVAVGPGAHPVDLPGEGEAAPVRDPDPSEPLIIDDEPSSGGPIVINQASLAKLTGAGAEGARVAGADPERYSTQPNRPVIRRDTRPGPDDDRPRVAESTKRRAEPRSRAAGMPVSDPKKLYAWAMARREEGQWAQAVGAFDEVTRRYPQHHLADNAIYWTGVCHAARGAQKDALKAWRSLPMRYPRSPKLPDALYGMAQAHEALGERQTAIDLYAQLIDQYPKAERVGAARAALARLRGR